MSEFKFACPVCGQHITAASTSSGERIECPTCYRKIVVPQAPTSDSKLILSASQADKPKPVYTHTSPEPLEPREGRSFPFLAFLLVVVGASGAALFIFREDLFQTRAASNHEPHSALGSNAPFSSPYPIPTNSMWEMDLETISMPDTRVAGRVRGVGFFSERTTLQGGNLGLRQGKTWPPDLGVSITLHAQHGEDLAGRTIQVGPERPPPVPRITLRWKENGETKARNFYSGYTMRIIFGQPEKNRMPGRIYLALPDEDKTFVAGTFVAEIRKPNPDKNKTKKSAQKEPVKP